MKIPSLFWLNEEEEKTDRQVHAQIDVINVLHEQIQSGEDENRVAGEVEKGT